MSMLTFLLIQYGEQTANCNASLTLMAFKAERKSVNEVKLKLDACLKFVQYKLN